MNKAVFFDKDGVLNVDKDISGTSEPVEFTAGIDKLIALFRDRDFKIIVVTNQPIVARGLLSEAELNTIFKDFQSELLKKNSKAVIDRIYYCPHHLNATVEKYRKSCACRKPKPGMFFDAAKDFNIDLKKSFMVGDRISDIIAGHLAGCTTIQFMSGKHKEKMIETDLENIAHIKPDYTINDLNELKKIIL